MKIAVRAGRAALALGLTSTLVWTGVGPASALDSSGPERPVLHPQIQTLAAAPEEELAGDQERAVPIFAIIGAALALGGSYYAMGERAGQRAYYAGLRNAEYQRVKWSVRSLVFSALGPVGMPIFMTGFENKFYSMS
jgi:hypothetical protein